MSPRAFKFKNLYIDNVMELWSVRCNTIGNNGAVFAGSNPAEAVGFFRAKKSSARLPSEGK
jgi:hypothetical protein